MIFDGSAVVHSIIFYASPYSHQFIVDQTGGSNFFAVHNIEN